MKINDEILEFAIRFYSDNHSFDETKKAIFEKYNVVVCETAIGNRFKKMGIKPRGRREVGKIFLKKKLSEETINNIKTMYIQDKKGIRTISKLSKIQRNIIRRTLVESGINIRDNDESIVLTHRKHKRVPFNRNEQEKAYLIGLAEGDIHARKKSKFTLRLTSASTHRAFIYLLKNIFEKYGPVYVYPVRSKNYYQWNITIDLDLETFSFLLNEKRKEYINKLDKDMFFSFLAGLIDSDGSVYLKKTGRYVQCSIRIFAEDIGLLNKLKFCLKSMEYHPNLSISAKKREIRSNIFVYNEDYFTLELCQKREVMKLLGLLPLRHLEKTKRKEIILNLENKTIRHEDLVDIVNLRKEIKIDVIKYTSEAKTVFESKESTLYASQRP